MLEIILNSSIQWIEDNSSVDTKKMENDNKIKSKKLISILLNEKNEWDTERKIWIKR